MARNLSCGCLCHGSNGNRIGDEYFSCKGCYGANHMNQLPQKVAQTKAAPKGPRKPRAAAKPIKTFTPDQATRITAALKDAVEAKFDGVVKTATKQIMEEIAVAAEELKANA